MSLSLRMDLDAVPTPGSLVVVQTALAEGWELSGGESGVRRVDPDAVRHGNFWLHQEAASDAAARCAA